MYCEIVYFIEENNCEKRHADLKPRGYNCFWIDPAVLFDPPLMLLYRSVYICLCGVA